jgi:predicted Zn finger-like uncharacterized protein
MKFHCERCKTKYSISDERVRGKILKIRCKNCSSVITVREAKASAPAIPAAAKAAVPKAAAAPEPAAVAQARAPASGASSAGQAALAGAFKHAVNNPESSSANMKSATSPVSLEAEWYLSKDGKQEGPFSMEEAHTWVSDKSPEDELYCWSEGFDDWLPTEKISHFRGIRVGSFSDLDSPDEHTMIDGAIPFANPVETPKPLFAATMEAVATNEAVALDDDVHIPRSAPELAKPASVAPPIPGQQVKAASSPMFAPAKSQPALASSASAVASGKPSADLAIGEASRVVDLAALMSARGNAPSISPSGGVLPGTTRTLGNGTGMAPALNDTGGFPGMAPVSPQLAPLGGLGSKPKKRRSSVLLTLIGASVAIALGAGLLVYLMSGDDEENRIARGNVGGSGNLGYSFNDNRGDSKTPTTAVVPTGVTPETKTQRKVKPTGGPKTPRVVRNTNSKNKPSDEVDLTGSRPNVATGPLDPEEFMAVVRKSDLLIKMCYRASTKKNPLLKVPKSKVDVRISKSGKVTSVKISNIGTTPLGLCLASRIKRWKFRQLTESFSGQFPLVFKR